MLTSMAVLSHQQCRVSQFGEHTNLAFPGEHLFLLWVVLTPSGVGLQIAPAIPVFAPA